MDLQWTRGDSCFQTIVRVHKWHWGYGLRLPIDPCLWFKDNWFLVHQAKIPSFSIQGISFGSNSKFEPQQWWMGPGPCRSHLGHLLLYSEDPPWISSKRQRHYQGEDILHVPQIAQALWSSTFKLHLEPWLPSTIESDQATLWSLSSRSSHYTQFSTMSSPCSRKRIVLWSLSSRSSRCPTQIALPSLWTISS